MIGLGFHNSLNTTLDINGPYLRFTTEPETVTGNDGGTVHLTGIATAEFKHNPSTIPGERVTNTGAIAYQWYINGTAAEDSSNISGSQTNQITLSNLSSSSDNNKSIVLRATYEASAYQSEAGAITAGIARSTGNGFNQPLDSTAVLLVMNPLITITTQPQSQTGVLQQNNATFTIAAQSSDGTPVSYQWRQNGVPLTDSDANRINGARTATLQIGKDVSDESNIDCIVSHPTASNSPLASNTVTLGVVETNNVLICDHINYYQAQYFNQAPLQIGKVPGTNTRSALRIVADPNRVTSTFLLNSRSYSDDVHCFIVASAAAGQSRNGNQGGEGGTVAFDFTFKKDTEYALKMGGTSAPTGGKNGGGGGVFLYENGVLILALGGGGGAGTLRGEPDAHGGNGGGANVAGSPGRGRNGGAGGINGDLTVVGVGNWPSDTTIGGRASRCTVGNNFFRQFSPCAIYSDQTGNFTASDWGAGGAGAELRDHARSLENVPITQTQIIRRGFKPGLAYRNNGGDGTGGNGGGGAGAYGGNAGSGGGFGGGGGSGWTSMSFGSPLRQFRKDIPDFEDTPRQIITSTQSGGNTFGQSIFFIMDRNGLWNSNYAFGGNISTSDWTDWYNRHNIAPTL